MEVWETMVIFLLTVFSKVASVCAVPGLFWSQGKGGALYVGSLSSPKSVVQNFCINFSSHDLYSEQLCQEMCGTSNLGGDWSR